MTRTKDTLGVLAAVTAALALSLCGCRRESAQSLAAREIANRLPSILGPAKSYDVQVEATPIDLLRGHAQRVVVDGVDVQLSPGLIMNTVHIDARGLDMDSKNRELKDAGSVEFTCKLGQIHLDQYLAQQHQAPGLAVQIGWTDIRAWIPVSKFGVTTTAEVDGNLEPSQYGPDKLDFVADAGQLWRIPLPRRLVEMAMDRVNPVIDLSGLPYPIVLRSAQANAGTLVVDGSAIVNEQDDRKPR